MAVKERKGIKKHKRQGSFISEYNYEITIVVLIALGIFLLVEDLEIKHYMYLGLRWFLFSIGDIIKGIRDNVNLLLEELNLYAEDRNYVDNLKSIIRINNLEKFDKLPSI